MAGSQASATLPFRARVLPDIGSQAPSCSSLGSAQQKAFTSEDDVSPSDMEGDHPPSSPNISESSDSDVTSRLLRHSKRHHTRALTPSPATQAHPGQSHMRVKGPAEVIQRYKKVLKTFSWVRTMSEAFCINAVGRGTIKMTAPIAELKYVDPEKFASLKFDPAVETLLAFARKCARNITSEKQTVIEDMKSQGNTPPFANNVLRGCLKTVKEKAWFKNI
ncbi:coiled-coil domain-containing protein 106-like [Mugil cephalus]|uniref:coiled-coil domain-containing protein 106-like n=1 Tax=Mugil cephalus TaxID=48193 RepID=UPI001FB7930A|nr:coiled-coil domain-containing protein 106-like [Mugil cephalus]